MLCLNEIWEPKKKKRKIKERNKRVGKKWERHIGNLMEKGKKHDKETNKSNNR